MNWSQFMMAQQITETEQRMQTNRIYSLIEIFNSTPAIYLLQEFIAMRIEDESDFKMGDSSEKRDLDFIEKEMTRFNETRFSVAEGEKRVQITRQRKKKTGVVCCDRWCRSGQREKIWLSSWWVCVGVEDGMHKPMSKELSAKLLRKHWARFEA